jgi:hypothetical protein
MVAVLVKAMKLTVIGHVASIGEGATNKKTRHDDRVFSNILPIDRNLLGAGVTQRRGYLIAIKP